MMRVADFSSERAVTNEADLAAILAKRYPGGVNAFYLSHTDDKYPMLSILVKADVAYLHYFPYEGHAGFSSVATIEALPRGEEATFPMSLVGDEIGVLNDAIVPIATALIIAREFFFSKELPRSIEWIEL